MEQHYTGDFLVTLSIDINGIYLLEYINFSNNFGKAVTVKTLEETYNLSTTTILKRYKFPRKVLNIDSTIYAVGINWGNSSCSVAVSYRFGIKTVPIENTGERVLPSFVSYDERNVKCGQIVINRMPTRSKSSAYDIKKVLQKKFDKRWPFNIISNSNAQYKVQCDGKGGKREMYPEEIAGFLFKHMKTAADAYQNKNLSEVVIALPLYWEKSQVNALFTAAHLGEWKTVRLLPEPIAAAFAYFVEQPPTSNLNVLLCDLGGETLNITILEIEKNIIKLKSNKVNNKIGGNYFDKLIINFIAEKAAEKYGIHIFENNIYQLKASCQEIKHDLSVHQNSSYDVPKSDDTIVITRKEFEDLAVDYLNEIRKTIIDVENVKIDKVFQVGGGCRMPMIKNLLKKMFPHAEHCCNEQPDEIVAIGASYYAYNLAVNHKNCPNVFNESYEIPKKYSINDHLIDAVGISYGNSNCCIAVNRYAGIEAVPLDNQGQRLLPTYVSFDENHVKCGKIVVDRLWYCANSSVCNLKQIAGKRWEELSTPDNLPFKLIRSEYYNEETDNANNYKKIEDSKILIELQSHEGKIFLEPEEISSSLLKNIKKKVEEVKDERLTETVIAVPVSEERNKSIYDSAVYAGWETVHLLPEPIAAAFAYFAEIPIPIHCNILIFDLGGSTLRTCIAKIQNDEIEILKHSETDELCGRRFDELFIHYFKDILPKDYITTDLENNQKFMLECQKCKEQLSWTDKYIFKLDAIPYIENDYNDYREFEEINREDFEDEAGDLLGQMREYITSSVSNFEYDRIDKVLQVGGGCRMPAIKDLLKEMFPHAQHCCLNHPEEVIAVGAAYYAYDLIYSSRYDTPCPTISQFKEIKLFQPKKKTLWQRIIDRIFRRG